MKKSNFIILVLSTIGILLCSIAMCMCLLPQWNLFNQGIILGILGIVALGSTYGLYCHYEHKTVTFNKKIILSILVAITGIFTLGIGMSLSMVFDHLMMGILIGSIGIVVLLFLIPLYKGIKQ